jgi:hypothetical protein
MVTLLVLIIALDYYKLQKRKYLKRILIAFLLILGSLTLGIVIRDTVIMMTNADPAVSLSLHLIFIITGLYLIGACLTILVLERIKKVERKKTTYSVIFSVLGIMLIGLIATVVYLTFFVNEPIEKNSLHIGSALGFPALLLLSIGTILVIFDEPQYVLYHGLTAGSSWILTLLNIIALFSLTETQMNSYSGWIHAFHIVCGGTGLIGGFLSALFGISGQRKYAKLTGYITLGCWWTAYMVATFIANV